MCGSANNDSENPVVVIGKMAYLKKTDPEELSVRDHLLSSGSEMKFFIQQFQVFYVFGIVSK